MNKTFTMALTGKSEMFFVVLNCLSSEKTQRKREEITIREELLGMTTRK